MAASKAFGIALMILFLGAAIAFALDQEGATGQERQQQAAEHEHQAKGDESGMGSCADMMGHKSRGDGMMKGHGGMMGHRMGMEKDTGSAGARSENLAMQNNLIMQSTMMLQETVRQQQREIDQLRTRLEALEK